MSAKFPRTTPVTVFLRRATADGIHFTEHAGYRHAQAGETLAEARERIARGLDVLPDRVTLDFAQEAP